MASLDGWLSGSQNRADFDATTIINRDVVTLTLARGNSEITLENVRVVPSSVGGGGGSATQGGNTATDSDVTVICPESADINNPDIRKGDIFNFRGSRYKVSYVDTSMPGQTQARAQGTQ